MARPKNTKPTLTHHKQTNQARCWFNGKWYYLGVYGSPESYQEYAKLLTKIDNSTDSTTNETDPSKFTIAELCALFMQHAEKHYRKPDGTPTSEVSNFDRVVAALTDAFPKLPVAQFSPLKLQAVRKRLIDAGACRKSINKDIGRIRLMWKWAVSQELVSVTIAQALESVAGLQKGRTEAHDNEPVEPVGDDVVNATLPYLPTDEARALVKLQRHTGCRSGEALSMRLSEIDRTSDVWIFTPSHHKTAHKGKGRIIAIGKAAQSAITDMLPSDSAKRVFSGYSVASYRRAIFRAVEKANVERSEKNLPPLPQWNPHQLRHTAATEIRERFGIEAARDVLGHADAGVTLIYAEASKNRAISVAREIG